MVTAAQGVSQQRLQTCIGAQEAGIQVNQVRRENRPDFNVGSVFSATVLTTDRLSIGISIVLRNRLTSFGWVAVPRISWSLALSSLKASLLHKKKFHKKACAFLHIRAFAFAWNIHEAWRRADSMKGTKIFVVQRGPSERVGVHSRSDGSICKAQNAHSQRITCVLQRHEKGH